MSQPQTAPQRPEPADFPLVAALPPEIDAEQAFLRLADRPHCLFFDSARRDPVLGRYSFVTADPFDFLEVLPAAAQAHDRVDALDLLAERMRDFVGPSLAGLPPFQGGAAGLVSYDLGRQLERLPTPAIDEFAMPALAMGLYDVVVAFDHGLSQAWILSQGWPERDPDRRRRRAQDR
ncbi:MAG TPA: hypothetical protein VIK18_25085, partial [Pirellulales bacterium]